MKLAFQGINNGNGKLTLTADNLKFACQELGIADDTHTLRRAARAFDLYHSGKVEHVNNHTFKVASQYDRQEPYKVMIKQTPYLPAGGYAYCTCEDWMNYSGDQDLPDVNFWCKHSIAALVWLHNNGNGTKKVVNECGSNEAKAIQDRLNDSQNNNGNGAQKAPSQTMSLDIRDPFQESEQLDIDQIEGRRNGEVTWKLRNGEYVISYKGIMELANKHHITFDEAVHSDTYTVIAKGRCGTSERFSGKPILGNANTALELAKRNAARQLLPYAELKAVEKKAQLEAEFNWQKAKTKCVELVGEANVSIIIHDLTQAGKLRADNPSHYDRTEWLLIHDYCKKDASITRDAASLNRWSYNSVVFLEQCKEAIEKVRTEKQVEANEQPLENSNGKRKLQMDKKLRTWLVESDGTKKEISCREICEQFESKQNPSIVTRLRAGIDSGADISTVELN
ncbi:MAG: hypothetical protein AAB116_06790 [Candidatus Poribacteria bacterium]